jgi:hypothetical protein
MMPRNSSNGAKYIPTKRAQLDVGRKLTDPQVFRVLWPENAGVSNGNGTEITLVEKFDGERIFLKIRWFVVIVPGTLECTCL